MKQGMMKVGKVVWSGQMNEHRLVNDNVKTVDGVTSNEII